MKKLLLGASLVLLVVGLLVAVAPARDGKNGRHTLNAELDGYQETPSISTTGSGEFKARLRDDSIEYKLRYGGLEGGTVLFAHIHLGQEHTAGGVVAFLCGGDGKPACPQSGTVRGTITAADVNALTAQGIAEGELDELVRAMKTGNTYANVHTDQFRSGEIRGQIGDDDDDDDDDRGGGNGRDHDDD